MSHSPTHATFVENDAEAIERGLGRLAFAADGTILRVNDAFLALYGYQGWDLIGRNRSILFPAAGRATDDRKAVERVFASGEPHFGDVLQQKRDGGLFWVDASYLPARDYDGAVSEIVLLARDATARRMSAADEAGQIAAINRSQAVIHFAVDGTILDANGLFLESTGYTLDEIVGRHHRIFVDPAEAASPAYAEFWERLRQGAHASGEYRRIRRDGKPLWLRATYNPVLDLNGHPFKIVKYALDVTVAKQQHADFQGQIAAIDRSQCIVSFAPDGTILAANDRFLSVVGYTMEELEGRHHRIFVDPAHVHSLDYEIFWSDLASGQHRGGEFRRFAKNGGEVWFQSTYSPVLDHDGYPIKIVMYATAITREKLRQADHQGQIAAIYKSQSVVSFAVDGTVLDANENFLELTGYRLSQVRGKHHAMFVAPVDRDSDAYAEFWRDLAAGTFKRGEFKRICKDGREIWLQASYNPIFDMNGRPFKVVKNAVDVTEEKLRQGDYEGQIAAIQKSQCVVSFDLDGTILTANDNFLAVMGYALDDVVGRHHRLFVDAATAASDEYREFWERLCAGQHLSSKFRRLARDGSEKWIQATYNPICDLNGRPFKIVKIATDITADVSLAADLTRAQREVQHDPATGLPNRLGLRAFLRRALAETDSELALLYLDLDHFKPINDTFGHDVGDLVLKTVAQRLERELGKGQLAARIGGDEFAIAAATIDRDEVAGLAQRLIATVSTPIQFGNRELEVGLSIGIALTPEDTLDEDELFRFADIALYRSKGKQRGIYTFYAEDYEASQEAERHMAHDMRIAIKAKQFVLSCSPCQIHSHDAPVAIEVRPEWNHPSLGRIGADRFMRVAEQSGLIVPLGDWMLREACKLAHAWRGTVVSVPFYPKQLLSSDVPGLLALTLRETGLDPRYLEIRLEQGSTRVNAASLRSDLARVRALGVALIGGSFLIDDDGLAAQATWPVDRLIVDARLRKLLQRRSPALSGQIGDSEAQDIGVIPIGGTRVFHLDRDHCLHSLITRAPMEVDLVTRTFERTVA